MKRQDIRNIIIAAFVLLLLSLLIIAIVFEDKLLSSEASSGKRASEYYDELQSVQISDETYVRRDELSVYLIVGLDAHGKRQASTSVGSSGIQSDVLLLFAVDRNDKSYKIIQLNRDTMTDYETFGVLGDSLGKTYGQLALAHSYGDGMTQSAENTVNAVSNLLYGIKINGYATFTMDAVAVMSDAVGGVTLTLSEDYTELDSSYTVGSEITLRGDKALEFVRARSSMNEPTNTARMKRQQEFMSAFLSQLEPDKLDMTSLVSHLEPYTVTNIPINDIDLLANCVCEKIIIPEGESKEGAQFMEFYPDEGALKKLVTEVFYNKSSR